MSSICKMSIQGIRSFGPEEKDKGVIEFFSPLTLILGPNGTGKTTIIECLKYMTTGEMPPGSKVGGAFIHDPKIAHEREVKAQIRLQFRDVKGEICVGQRSILAMQQAKNITTKTLDGVITRKLKDGTKASISKRCADMDKEIVALLGVSKPVLDHVIFCHQEESNWPLSEGKALKQKFDDIFASTRYVKALEAIRVQKKNQTSIINECKIEVKHLKQNKEKAALIRADLEERESRYIASRENVEKINEKLEPIEEKLTLIDNRLSDIYQVKTNMEKLKSEKSQMDKNIDELKDEIGTEFEGSTDDLRKTLRQFERQVQEKEEVLEQNIMKKSQFENKLERINDKKSDLLLKQGKLEQEAERQKTNIEKRNLKLKEVAESLDIAGFASSVDDSVVEQFFETLNEQASARLTSAKQTKSKYEEKEAISQKQLDKERNKKTTLETQQKMKQDQMSKNKSEIRNLNQQLSDVVASGEHLKNLELDLKRKEQCVQDTEKVLDINKMKSEIQDSQQEKTSYDTHLKDLDAIISKMTRESSVRSELEVFHKERTSKEDQVRRLKAKNEDSIRQVLGSFPTEGLSLKLEKYMTKQAGDIRKIQTNLQGLRSKIATLEADKKNFSDQLRKKETELQEKEEKINTVCHSQSLEQGIEKIKKDIANEEDTRGSLTGMTYLYKRYQQKLSEDDPPCPLCHRPFENQDEVDELVRELEGKLSVVPQKKDQCDQKLKRYKDMHEKMLLLGPVKQEITKLQNEIPLLKSRVRDMLQTNEATTLDIGEQEDLLEAAQSDETMAKNVQPDVTMIEDRLKDIRELAKKIESLGSKLSGEDFGRTMEDVQNEREDLQIKLEAINTKLDRQRTKLSESSERLQQEKAAMIELRAKKLKMESDMQKRVRLEEQKEKLENLNMVLLSEIDDAKVEIAPLQEKLNEMTIEVKNITAEKERQWEKDKKAHLKIKESKRSVEMIHEEVQQYLLEGKDKKLERTAKEMDHIEQQAATIMTDKEKVLESITSVRKELDQQTTQQRELSDNLKLRDKKKEVMTIIEQIRKLEEKLGDLDVSNLSRERQQLLEKQDRMIKEKHQLEGRKQGLQDEIKKLKKELKDDMFKDAEKNYRDQQIKLRTTELANQDLDKYYRALDMAIMNYHNKKMSDINKIIRELWRNTYKGNDIETIEIRSDQEEKASTAGCDKRRTYQYRVVMIKGDTAIDMRGRCSAGQKVLCSIIIRLALAETFCLNCGIFALDEPTTNLDRENIESLAYALVEIIKSRSRQSNFQLVVITHDEDFVELLGRSDYVEEFFKVRKDMFGCSQLVKARVQDLHTR